MDIKVLENKNEFACLSYLLGDLMIDAGVDPGVPVKKLILTHCHFDHVLYVNVLKKKYNTKVYASKKCALNLKREDTFDPFHDKKIKGIVVDEIIKEGDIIEGLEVIETPGHTDGSICLFNEKDRILFSGDTLFKDGFGRTDLPTGNEKQLLKSLERIKKISPLRVYPGH